MKVLIGSIILAGILLMCMGCESLPECPVCEECSEGIEDPYLCSKYYVDKANPLTDPLVATRCLTCGIYFTYPDYGEHIKTCCP